MSRLADLEVLFKDKGWEIQGIPGYEDICIPGYEDIYDFVQHKCPWMKNWLLKKKSLSVYDMKNGSYCPHCGEDIPDSIMGVWKLKNFDLLQKEAEYGSSPGGFYMTGNTNVFIGKNAGQATTGASNALIGTSKKPIATSTKDETGDMET